MIWNGQNVFFSNIIHYTKISVMLIPTSCYIFFRMHAMSIYGIETWFMKLDKKDLNNILVVYQKAIKHICGRNSYSVNLECLEYARLPTFKHFLVRKFICYVHRIFPPNSSCLMIHKPYLKYNSVFQK